MAARLAESIELLRVRVQVSALATLRKGATLRPSTKMARYILYGNDVIVLKMYGITSSRRSVGRSIGAFGLAANKPSLEANKKTGRQKTYVYAHTSAQKNSWSKSARIRRMGGVY